MSKQPTPRQTPRVSTVDPRFANLDDRTIALINNNIRSRIYQRSINLRRTFHLLDPQGKGKVTYNDLVSEMTKTYQLSDVEQHCLRILVDRADYKKDGFIDFVEFTSIFKMFQSKAEENTMSESEKRRFQGQGFVDPRLNHLILCGDKSIPMVAEHPTNELGKMTIEAPFGVLGDSERMDSMIQAFLTTKFDKLRQTLQEVDKNNTGRLTYDEFHQAIKKVDRYVFDSEIENLLAVLDKKKKGFVIIDQFMEVLGQEFLKKKAHRGAPLNPLVWGVKDKAPRTPRWARVPPVAPLANWTRVVAANGDSPRSLTATKSLRPRKPINTTRTQGLREAENKVRLQNMIQREDEEAQLLATHSPRIPHPPGGSTQRATNVK